MISDTSKRELQYWFAALVGRRFARRGQARVLTFHDIVPGDKPTSTAMSAESFVACIEWLHRVGYQTVAVGSWSSALPSKNIVALTFDDAYASHWDIVRPTLLRYGMTATFFVPTSPLCEMERASMPPGHGRLLGKRLMTWDQILDLRRDGFEIGSHGCRHLPIASLPENEARSEIEESKCTLESRLACSIRSFAYPYGREGSFSQETRQMLLACGYQVACTQLGCALASGTDPMQLSRTNVEALDGPGRFRMKVEGAYDLGYSLRHAMQARWK